jgi:hypothetical protein
MKYTKVKTKEMYVVEKMNITINVVMPEPKIKPEPEPEPELKRPFNLDDLRPFNGSKLDICGHIFELVIGEDLSGDHAIFTYGTDYRIYATPNYEGVPVPVEINVFSSELIATDGYYFPISSAKEYFKVVKTMAEMLFEDNKIIIKNQVV